jgi:hypothetical protein
VVPTLFGVFLDGGHQSLRGSKSHLSVVYADPFPNLVSENVVHMVCQTKKRKKKKKEEEEGHSDRVSN